MLSIVQTVRKSGISILIRLLPLLSFIVPILLLYSLYPESFEGGPTWEGSWEGRFLYVFFLWLVSLEIILSWETLQPRKVNIDRHASSSRTAAFIIALLYAYCIALPTIYVVAANYFGVNTAIADLAKQNNIYFYNLMPLAVEYIVFAALFGLITFLVYGIKGMKNFSISAFFLVIIGVIYAINNAYPFGRFGPFQFFVPTTTNLAANVLNLMGYHTGISFRESSLHGYMPYLTAWDPNNPSRNASFGIAWPCAGVESLLIYTVTLLLFLKKSEIPWIHRIIYFAIGAIVTYVINILRIATIFAVAINGGDWLRFHNIYGPMSSIIWIVCYPFIIIGSRSLWRKIRSQKAGKIDHESLKVSPKTNT